MSIITLNDTNNTPALDFDLLAPVTVGAEAISDELPSMDVTPVALPSSAPDKALPSLDDLLASMADVLAAETTMALPPLAVIPNGIAAAEPVSVALRANGGNLDAALKAAAHGTGSSGSGFIQTPEDVQYACRVFAAHAVQALSLARQRELLRLEGMAAAAVNDTHTALLEPVLKSAVIEHRAADGLEPGEVEYIMEHIKAGRLNIAQRIVGPSVDVRALAAGYDTDWRPLADAWAAEAKTPGSVTVADGSPAVGTDPGKSYSLSVKPGEGWVLSVWTAGTWVPLQASSDARDRAVEDRAAALDGRRLDLGDVFADELG